MKEGESEESIEDARMYARIARRSESLYVLGAERLACSVEEMSSRI